MREWKYIVYQTTNIVNNKIYVGIHKTKDPDTFDGYLGNGIYATQPYTYQYAKTKFQYAVKKYGSKNFRRKTLAIFNTIEEASDLEEQIVNEKFLARPDVYNMVLGGIDGYFKYKNIKVYQYALNGSYINEYTSMADAALQMNCDYTLISYAVRKKAIAKNYLWSTDKLDKLDLTLYNLGNNHQIKLYLYNIKGDYIGAYKNQNILAKELNVSTTTIRNSRLLGSVVAKMYYVSEVKADSYDLARSIYLDNRPVYKYDSKGVFIQGYSTQKEALLKNPNSNINKSIRLKSVDDNNFMWSLEKLEYFNQPKVNEKKRVGKFDLKGNLVKEYESATQAAKENGTSVWKVLSGINQTHKSHVYKYI